MAYRLQLRLICFPMTQAQATPPVPPTASSPAPRPPQAGPGRNFISEDVEIKGTLVFASSLTVNGRITGEILSGGSLTIGASGNVDGDIQASAVAVHGIVKGNITVEDRCELRGDAELVGDLDAPRLVIEEGVTLVGNVKVRPKDPNAPKSGR